MGLSVVDYLKKWDRTSQLQSAKNESMSLRWAKSLMWTNVTGRVGQLDYKYLGSTVTVWVGQTWKWDLLSQNGLAPICDIRS